ncbi:bsr8225 [Bradyrhizobium diazoefficiens USDA 110]|uniref:Bsr8225 protein n=1 Tax=Bradyrhizobium diazoefficiens (strain JCM 10833 / BCRC 13528 / IAM 13628 / NBRC 14792 / USDA 110) TaxID=224911 RepID=Q89BD1_BRADU|nr:bsr8225 [Bradyrhizobium diazoefficiens USDA 110]
MTAESQRRHPVGGLDASTSPPKERYAVSNDNVIQPIQPGIVDDQLTEVLRNGARAFSPRRSRPKSQTFSASMPI